MKRKKSTKKEHARRLAEVEMAIHEHGWSMRLEQALAARFGVLERTVRKYRQEVEDTVLQEINQDRKKVRASLLTRIRGHQAAARQSGKLGPLAAMLNLEARITGAYLEDGEDDSRDVQVVLGVPGFGDDDSDA